MTVVGVLRLLVLPAIFLDTATGRNVAARAEASLDALDLQTAIRESVGREERVIGRLGHCCAGIPSLRSLESVIKSNRLGWTCVFFTKITVVKITKSKTLCAAIPVKLTTADWI